MDTLSLVSFLIAPLAMGLGGFVAARRLRALENAVFLAGIFSERKLLFSIGVGLLMGLFFTLLRSPGPMQYLVFLELSALSAIGYHAGISLGWDTTRARPENLLRFGAVHIPAASAHIFMDELPDSLRITINNRPRSTWRILQWMGLGFFALPLFVLAVMSIFQSHLPVIWRIVALLLFIGLAFTLVYLRFRASLETIYDREVIEIDAQSVRVELSGVGFTSRQRYLARDIDRLTSFYSLFKQPLSNSRFRKPGFPALTLWLQRGPQRMSSFGSGLTADDAGRIIEVVHQKFPQYRG